MTVYSSGLESLDVDTCDDPTRLAFCVVGSGQLPTARLSFEQVVQVRQELDAWIERTRPLIPLQPGDPYDGRAMNDGAILRPAEGAGPGSWTRISGQWRVSGDSVTVDADVFRSVGAVVAWVPGP